MTRAFGAFGKKERGSSERLTVSQPSGRDFWHEESGATAIEYGMVALLISIVVITLISAIGDTVLTNYYLKILAAF